MKNIIKILVIMATICSMPMSMADDEKIKEAAKIADIKNKLYQNTMDQLKNEEITHKNKINLLWILVKLEKYPSVEWMLNNIDIKDYDSRNRIHASVYPCVGMLAQMKMNAVPQIIEYYINEKDKNKKELCLISIGIWSGEGNVITYAEGMYKNTRSNTYRTEIKKMINELKRQVKDSHRAEGK